MDVTDQSAAADLRAEVLGGTAAATALVALGHAAFREALRPGVTELQLWSAVREGIERAAGGEVEAEVDLMAGSRTVLVGEPPSDARIEPGDPVLFDLALRSGGSWADSCVTVVAGQPEPALVHRHGAVRGALDVGREAARPGVSAGELDAAIRAALAAHGLVCPHHTGHGVGAEARQAPWIVPGAPAVLEPGMVIALEPGAYSGGFGVRLEHLFFVESGGARPLTHHSLSLTRDLEGGS